MPSVVPFLKRPRRTQRKRKAHKGKKLFSLCERMHTHIGMLMGSYYTGSTKYLDLRFAQHQAGKGINYTKKGFL